MIASRWILKTLLLCVGVGFSTSLWAQQPARNYTLQLKWFHQYQFAGYYAALEKGFYREEGLNVTIRERDPAISPVEAVLNNTADFGVSDSTLVLRRLKGDPVVILAAIFQQSPLVLMALEESGIANPLDMLGKRVMYQREIDDALILALFNEMGMRAKDIEYLPHNFDDMALVNGYTDVMSAYITNQPYLYRQQGYAVNVINPGNYGIDFYGDNLFTREQLMQQYPEDVIAFRRASIRGWQYALDNPEEIVQLIQQKYSGKHSIEKLRYEAEATRRVIRPRLVEVGNVNMSRLRRIADIYIEQGMVNKEASLEGIYYEQYLQVDGPFRTIIHGLVALLVLVLGLVLFQRITSRRLHQAVKRQTRELSHAKQEMDEYLRIVDTYTITAKVDDRFRFSYASDALCRISGYPLDTLLGENHTLICHPEMDTKILQNMIEALEQGANWSGEWMCKAVTGETFFLEANAQPEYEGSIFSGYTLVGVDVTDKKRVELLAVTDPLTLLFNRSKLNTTIRNEIKRSQRNHLVYSVILFDLDHFKDINDNYGHSVGDSVLITVASITRQRAREIDVVGRWGGEEFLIVCIDTDLNGAVKLAEELRAAIANYTFDIIGQVTSSFGVAEYQPGESESQLLDRVDRALYQAKENGRNQVAWDAAVADKPRVQQ